MKLVSDLQILFKNLSISLTIYSAFTFGKLKYLLGIMKLVNPQKSYKKFLQEISPSRFLSASYKNFLHTFNPCYIFFYFFILHASRFSRQMVNKERCNCYPEEVSHGQWFFELLQKESRRRNKKARICS